MASLSISQNTIGISSARGAGTAATKTSQTTQSASDKASNTSATSTQTPRELTLEQRRQVSELKQIDRAVRDHEQAHIAAGHGVITSGPNYSFTYGPDGKQYAIGGEVGIDTSPESEPEANIGKGQRVQSAALAPAEPSPQDYRVASVGAQLEERGHVELSDQIAAERVERMARQTRAREEHAKVRQETAPIPNDNVVTPAPSSPQEDEALAPVRLSDATRQALARAYVLDTFVDKPRAINLLA